jgi:hypothetical protein
VLRRVEAAVEVPRHVAVAMLAPGEAATLVAVVARTRAD